MYFVDRQHIENTLRFMEQQLELLQKVSECQNDIERAAFERTSHIIIESILDVGNAMIDGFIMRDPGSYEDIVDILNDEKVVSDEMQTSLKVIVGYRKMLVQQYIEIDHSDLSEAFKKHLHALEQFSGCVRTYLLSELGPVSAFKN
ncbi:DUF86 domain-containing protein [Falsibacillus albus]|uniref:DUF86 domain-containing protein n=1 Tax=Falsibacillus albus TaxID=2478915 RepID=A0A3L7K1P6_9BACI|nr:DUF86 domain-containing protein [Falsibacillus albus]RLQ96535.1 DUF86 domain-containing protein [Falsibacillus albus]